MIERRESSTSLAKSKQLNALSIKLSRLIKQGRERLLTLLRRIEDCLRRIITDQEGEGRLLQNPDDPISFDLLLNEEKRLEGRLVLDSLVEFNRFVSAFAYRLNEGDLSGAGPRIELNYVYDVDPPETPRDGETAPDAGTQPPAEDTPAGTPE
jgi:hypothetical protein